MSDVFRRASTFKSIARELRPQWKKVLTGLAAVSILSSCASGATTADSDRNAADIDEVANVVDEVHRLAAQKICDEAESKVSEMKGAEEIQIRQCEAQPGEQGQFVWILQLNDTLEWTQLWGTLSTEDIVFTLPLSLVASSFASSNEEPALFDKILIVFDDVQQTVYEFTSSDLNELLKAEDEEAAKEALLSLRNKMLISALK